MTYQDILHDVLHGEHCQIGWHMKQILQHSTPNPVGTLNLTD